MGASQTRQLQSKSPGGYVAIWSHKGRVCSAIWSCWFQPSNCKSIRSAGVSQSSLWGTKNQDFTAKMAKWRERKRDISARQAGREGAAPSIPGCVRWFGIKPPIQNPVALASTKSHPIFHRRRCVATATGPSHLPIPYRVCILDLHHPLLPSASQSITPRLISPLRLAFSLSCPPSNC